MRKAYDSGEIHHGFNEYREPEPRTDGLSNTVTTVSKDNYMLEVKQATKQGYALCEIGGDSKLGISSQRNTQRPSNRERKDKSNTNDGEYP